MIEQISDKSKFNEWTKKDIYTIRILALLDAYNCKYPFVTFYRQIICGEVTAIMSKLDNNFTLSLNDNADNEEIANFISTIGYETVLSDEKFVFKSGYKSGAVMKTSKCFEFSAIGAKIDEYPKLMDLFNLIDYEKQDFESWYVDINHRIRHGAAKAYALTFWGEMVSSAIFSSIHKNYAVLTAVSTKPEFRRMGYASFLVSSMISDFGGTVFLMREKDMNETFYKKIGFENCGEWRIYK